eukprot:1180831-Prorocentrum_minimum.AAC.2
MGQSVSTNTVLHCRRRISQRMWCVRNSARIEQVAISCSADTLLCPAPAAVRMGRVSGEGHREGGGPGRGAGGERGRRRARTPEDTQRVSEKDEGRKRSRRPRQQ